MTAAMKVFFIIWGQLQSSVALLFPSAPANIRATFRPRSCNTGILPTFTINHESTKRHVDAPGDPSHPQPFGACLHPSLRANLHVSVNTDTHRGLYRAGGAAGSSTCCLAEQQLESHDGPRADALMGGGSVSFGFH